MEILILIFLPCFCFYRDAMKNIVATIVALFSSFSSIHKIFRIETLFFQFAINKDEI